MKLSQKRKVLGLAFGERSLLVAEVSASQRPKVDRVAEFVYPPDHSLADPVALGKAFGKFLSENEFSARSAVAGIPIKWVLVKSKSVPSVDKNTLVSMLRLEAESEFSSELKDLTFEYAESAGSEGKTILLLATPKKNVDAAALMCETARVSLMAVSPTALALGRALGTDPEKQLLVLSLGQGGSEITSQQGASASAMRHLRSADPKALFVSELRRTMTMLPGGGGGFGDSGREMVLWNGIGAADMDARSLSEQLGMTVRSGELSRLGVDAASATAAANGQSQKFAGAVALAVAALDERGLTADFLHSRLAPPQPKRIPRWTILASVAGVGVIVLAVMAYNDLQQKQADLDALNAQLTKAKPLVTAATAAVAKADLAWQWHSDTPRYLACLRDLTLVVPSQDVGLTYVTTLTLRDEQPHAAGTTGAASHVMVQTRRLDATIDGRAPDQSAAVRLVDQLNHNPEFVGAKLENATPVPRQNEVTFKITFTYDPDANTEKPRTAGNNTTGGRRP